jgi:hypothetical protein
VISGADIQLLAEVIYMEHSDMQDAPISDQSPSVMLLCYPRLASLHISAIPVMSTLVGDQVLVSSKSITSKLYDFY